MPLHENLDTFYGTSAQVIPILVLIFVVQARGFADTLYGGSSYRIPLYLLLLSALASEVAAFIALSLDIPDNLDRALVLLIFGGVVYSLTMAGLGVGVIVRNSIKPASDKILRDIPTPKSDETGV